FAQDFTFKFKKDKTYRYGMTSATAITQEVMGKEMKINVNSDIIYHLNVRDVNSQGDITFVAAIDSSKQTVHNPMKDTTIVGGESIGKRVELKISKEGKKLSATVLDSIAVNPMGGSDQRLQAFREHQLDASASAKAGSTWNAATIDTVNQSGLKLVVDSKTVCTVKGKESKAGHDCVVVEYTGTMKLDGKGAMMGMNMTAEGNGKIAGTFYFDTVAGVVINDDSKTDLDMTIATTGQQQMVIPVTQTVKMTRTLLGN
ncbi:MAG TPA: hypothetical protein VK470_20430, partial [Bacteroidota bacterium]|nr:hypothetical protein [Bacteroidota bacterium]